MSKMKSTLATTLLTLILAVPAFAGNIGTPGGSPPPPPPTADGNIGSPGSSSPENGPSDLSSPMLVDILLALLSLF